MFRLFIEKDFDRIKRTKKKKDKKKKRKHEIIYILPKPITEQSENFTSFILFVQYSFRISQGYL